MCRTDPIRDHLRRVRDESVRAPHQRRKQRRSVEHFRGIVHHEFKRLCPWIESTCGVAVEVTKDFSRNVGLPVTVTLRGPEDGIQRARQVLNDTAKAVQEQRKRPLTRREQYSPSEKAGKEKQPLPQPVDAETPAPGMSDPKAAVAAIRNAFDTQQGGGVNAGLLYLYTHHPMKGSLESVPQQCAIQTREQCKSSLLKALLHYHPDKHFTQGALWSEFAEEVAKILTAKYELFK